MLSRVARLSDEGRAVAELVSVVPGQAEPWLVESLAASPVEGLVACEAGGLLAVEAGNVRFRHELARRAVEDALAGARRRELNRAVLAVLTARGVDAARLAHHAREAGDLDGLVRHGLTAGRRAAAAGAHREACELLAPLLEHSARVPATERVDALELLSQEGYLHARPDLAIPARQAALVIRRAHGDPLATSASVRWLSRLCWWSGDRAGAEAAGDEAITVLDGVPPGRELAMALSNRSQLAMLAQQDEQATVWAERAIELAERLGDVETLVHATTNLGSVLVRDEPERGRALLEDAAERAIGGRVRRARLPRADERRVERARHRRPRLRARDDASRPGVRGGTRAVDLRPVHRGARRARRPLERRLGHGGGQGGGAAGGR